MLTAIGVFIAVVLLLIINYVGTLVINKIEEEEED
jgi:hypothetical protein